LERTSIHNIYAIDEKRDGCRFLLIIACGILTACAGLVGWLWFAQ
jgi:hypothetical protein